MFKQCIDNGLVDSAKLITSNVKSDVTLGAASKYALKAMGLSGDSITTYMIPGDGEYIGSTSYYLYDEEKTKLMLEEIYRVVPEEGDSDEA